MYIHMYTGIHIMRFDETLDLTEKKYQHILRKTTTRRYLLYVYMYPDVPRIYLNSYSYSRNYPKFLVL